MVKNLPAHAGRFVFYLGVRKLPLEEEMAIHSSILAWETPWTEGPGGLQFKELQRVVHSWAMEHVGLQRIKTHTDVSRSTGMGLGYSSNMTFWSASLPHLCPAYGIVWKSGKSTGGGTGSWASGTCPHWLHTPSMLSSHWLQRLTIPRAGTLCPESPSLSLGISCSHFSLGLSKLLSLCWATGPCFLVF